jgi:hypothetical protein
MSSMDLLKDILGVLIFLAATSCMVAFLLVR